MTGIDLPDGKKVDVSSLDGKRGKTVEVFSHGKTLSCEEIVELVLLSLNAHYQRDADKIESMMDELKHMDQEELALVLRGLRTRSPFHEAVPMLTNWIEAKLDGSIL